MTLFQGDVSYYPNAAVAMCCGIALVLIGLNRTKKKKADQLEQQQQADTLQQRIAEVGAITELPVVSPSEMLSVIFLNPGETCHYQVPANVLIYKNQVTGYTGGSAGVSVRVAKGVTLRSGSSRGKPIREDVPYTYPGVFTMTNQRFIMSGEKAFEHPISKLTALGDFGGMQGITLQFGKTSHTILMQEPFWVPKILDLLNGQ